MAGRECISFFSHTNYFFGNPKIAHEPLFTENGPEHGLRVHEWAGVCAWGAVLATPMPTTVGGASSPVVTWKGPEAGCRVVLPRAGQIAGLAVPA